MFDPGPEDRMGVMLKLVRALDSNRCDARCRVSDTGAADCVYPVLLCNEKAEERS